MSGSITLRLPWDLLCPDNSKYGVIRGRMLLTSRYRAAKEMAGISALAQMRTSKHGRFPLDCALSMHVILYPPDKRRRDATNLAKGLHDSLEGVCYEDDTQLKDVRYTMRESDKQEPRVEISISPITGDRE